MQRASTACGQPEAEHTSGLVAYLEDEPVGWSRSSRASRI